MEKGWGGGASGGAPLSRFFSRRVEHALPYERLHSHVPTRHWMYDLREAGEGVVGRVGEVIEGN